MSASKTPNSSNTQERNDKPSSLKLSLKGQPKSLPNLFESMIINEEGKKPKPYSQKNANVQSRVKSFEGKKVALNPVLTNIDEEKAISSNEKSQRQLNQELKETKEKILASRVGEFSSNALEAKMRSDYGKPLSRLRISNTDEEKAISSNKKNGTKETKEKVLASRVGYFSRNALEEAKMGSDYGPPSLKISNTDEVWAKIEKTQERSPTLKLFLKGRQSLPNLFESMNLQEGKTKPYSQNKVVSRY